MSECFIFVRKPKSFQHLFSLYKLSVRDRPTNYIVMVKLYNLQICVS